METLSKGGFLMSIQYYKSLPEVLTAMKNCYQFENVNIYDHGMMVAKEYSNILTSLELGIISEVLPEQLIDLYQKYNLLDFGIMLNYHILHDLSKPLVRVIDAEGRQHFPNHAEASYEQFKLIYPYNIDEAFMIKHDMDFHTLKPSELKELSESKYGFSLYLTSWAELISNAQMFSGFDSVSFKIKRKKLMKCLKLFLQEKYK